MYYGLCCLENVFAAESMFSRPQDRENFNAEFNIKNSAFCFLCHAWFYFNNQYENYKSLPLM